MSKLTAKLLGESARPSKMWHDTLVQAADRLVEQYGTPSLGNYRNPVKELFYILLSARTSEVLYQRACDRLFRLFPTIAILAVAEVEEIMDCIEVAGLGRKRSDQVRRLAKRLLADFGPRPERKLRTMSAPEVFAYLTDLPGVGPKSALCVMMYSLDIDVFPVDVNVRRIAERMGILPHGLKHYRAQRKLPKQVPDRRSKELHIGLVVHGRKVCLPGRPRCKDCILLDLCRTGTKLSAKTPA